ncbi:hypothetical protein CMUS01_09233 [Colletotrichum musicola]|uniref:N-acetyltransferase domain-containing protein n=1 Tax=Colletotrichum musicola TaxID=2175873 RepID=A0A8H6KA18_9PEZI|nr:hypothetical protein CMUS01_09233 [Colletotrichum musicola]
MEPLRLVRIRSADQLPALAEQASQSWIGSPIFDMLCPSHRSSPSRFRQVWRLILRNELATPGAVILAAFPPHCSSDDTKNAVGFAVWHRTGSSPTSQSWHLNSLQKKILRLRVFFEIAYLMLTRWLSLAGFLALQSAFEKVEKQHYPPERWRLSWLSVAPASQRRGVGRELLRWGVERGEEESVTVVLEASEMGRGLYASAGFEVVGWECFGGRWEGVRQPVMVRAPGKKVE